MVDKIAGTTVGISRIGTDNRDAWKDVDYDEDVDEDAEDGK